ncbi:hypothetical protein B0H19DRAFT_1055230 [Mycena capillaripes]|nr:hypothetical protein B0H19DRAFT_1055230 [Mycena capillaripes]
MSVLLLHSTSRESRKSKIQCLRTSNIRLILPECSCPRRNKQRPGLLGAACCGAGLGLHCRHGNPDQDGCTSIVSKMQFSVITLFLAIHCHPQRKPHSQLAVHLSQAPAILARVWASGGARWRTPILICCPEIWVISLNFCVRTRLNLNDFGHLGGSNFILTGSRIQRLSSEKCDFRQGSAFELELALRFREWLRFGLIFELASCGRTPSRTPEMALEDGEFHRHSEDGIRLLNGPLGK